MEKESSLLEELDRDPKVIVKTKNLRFVAYRAKDRAGNTKPAFFQVLSRPWQVGNDFLLDEEKFICQNWAGRDILVPIDHTEDPVL